MGSGSDGVEGRARPAIDLVSPLPPVRSGIADYTRDLLPHLESLCDLRVIRLPDQPVDDEVIARWAPVPAERTGEKGRLPLYEMGNNRHHEGVLALALERPGVVTLHDLVLHHLLVESTLAHGDHRGYGERLVDDHGWIGELTAKARRWGELGESAMFELPAHRTLLRRQHGVLVHSRWAAGRVREECEDVEVRTVPMGMPLARRASPEQAAAFRSEHALPLDRPLLGSFGFQTPIKRTAVMIEALARPELAAAHLVIVGEVSESLDLETRAREAGVADRVHVTGYIDFDRFETAIAACDLCINLRYPTAGETSASLLRVLAVGRPVVVSDYAQFAELPDDVAIKVPLGDGEAEALAAELGRRLAAPEELERMSEAARDYIARRHDPASAAAEIVAASVELGSHEPPGDRFPEVAPPTTLTWHETAGELSVGGADGPWPVGDERRLAVEIENRGECRWLATGEEAGGVLIEVQWRQGPKDPPLERVWCDLPRDLAPGESYRFEVAVRRPPGAGVLLVEPHIQGVSGFRALGGPSWLLEVAGAAE